MNERITEDIVRDFFKNNIALNNGMKVSIYEQKTDVPKIQKLLKRASKSGDGGGYPEFIVTFPSPSSEFLIVVECKANTSNHESKNRDQYKDYAVDGVLLYSSYLAKEYDVLSIAVSGQKEGDLKVSTFLQLKGNKKTKEMRAKELLSFDNYLQLYKYDPEKEKQSFDELLDYSQKLNEDLRDLDLPEGQRPLLVSAILIALEDPAFSNSYMSETRPIDLADSLVRTVVKILDHHNVPKNKKANMLNSFGFIKTHSILASDSKNDDGKYNTDLRDLIENIDKKVKKFSKTYEYYDVLGEFYQEFLRYANGDKGLGIVLTPQHITELFVDLADINEKNVVLDNCCGTGGFLISAMKRMIKLCSGNKEKEKKVYNKGLIGVESNSNMFSLACSNMLIRGDGKSNIYYGSCFDKVKEVMKHEPNVGFLNPPYSKKKEGSSELNFVLNNLRCLKPNSICIAIVPITSGIKDDKETIKLKEKILKNHSLDAVMSMPLQLFNPAVSVITAIMVFKAKVPHNPKKETWFGYWRDDGFELIKNKGRVDRYNRWNGIKEKWLDAYFNRKEIPGLSVKQKVTAEDEWCAEAYMETDYSIEVTPEVFKEKMKQYIAYKIKSKGV